ncbi:MAG: stage V sporulation protein AD [Ruminococcus sp.]|nr:stage V sporulation protein AD [Ruminococcus sp.]
MIKRLGDSTIEFLRMPSIVGFASAVGKKEAQGPLKDDFDKISYDMRMGQDTWEKAESQLQKEVLSIALSKAEKNACDIDFLFAGDLLNQCISSSYGLKDFSIPYLGQYGACSTMVQGLIMASVMVGSGASHLSACVTSSHFCSAERQYRFPLDYGGQRPQSSQWTVTGAGCCILSDGVGDSSPKVKIATVGRIVDLGVTDQNNMGAAMAPAATDTLLRFFRDTSTLPSDYDMIYTGDLGKIGSELLYELLSKEGFDIKDRHKDCGVMIFDTEDMDVHSGGSGCGCCSSVLCGHILRNVVKGNLKNILVMATGALLSPTSIQQSETIPSIAHLVNIVL